MNASSPLELSLEIARADATEDPFAFAVRSHTYLVRWGDGGWDSAEFHWDDEVFQTLLALQSIAPDPVKIHAIGRRLAAFLAMAGWEARLSLVEDALSRKRPVRLTIVAAAAELYVLPWELLPLRSSGHRLGCTQGISLGYAWPGHRVAPRLGASSRVLFAWSDAGGAVPVGDHLRVVREAWGPAFDEARDVLPRVTVEALSRRLEQGDVAFLHVLCHGGSAGSGGGSGLLLHGADGVSAELVDPRRLGEVVGAHVGAVRGALVSACNAAYSTPGSPVSSVAIALHRAGLAEVIASRYPLSVPGSIIQARHVHGALAGGRDVALGLEVARSELATGGAEADWIGMQRYSQPERSEEPLLPPRPLAARERAVRAARAHWRYVALSAGPLLAVFGWCNAVDLALQARLAALGASPEPVSSAVVLDIGETADRARAALRGEYPALLAEMVERRAEVVAFDMVFSRPDPVLDPAFAAAVLAARERGVPVVAAVRVSADAPRELPGTPALADALLPASPVVRRAATDQVLFGAPAWANDGAGQQTWALSVAALAAAGHVEPKIDQGSLVVGGHRAAVSGAPGDEPLLLLPPPGEVQVAPLMEVDRWPDLAGKAVFVGAARDAGDEFRHRWGITAGVTVHAVLYDAIFNGRMRRVASPLLDLCISALAIGACVVGAHLVRRRALVPWLVGAGWLAGHLLVVSRLGTSPAVLPPLLCCAAWAWASRSRQQMAG